MLSSFIRKGFVMGFTGRLILIAGLLLEALLFADVACAQVTPPPVPTPAPQPQTVVGRELAAAGQALADASNNVNAIVLLAIAVSVGSFASSVVMVVVLRGFMNAQKEANATQAARDSAEQDEKKRHDDAENKRTEAFTRSVNTFSEVTAGIARIETEVGLLKEDKVEARRTTAARDKRYFNRINTVEKRIVNSMNTFGDRMAHEIPQALRDGQVQAAQLLLDNLPEIFEKASSRSAPTVLISTEDPAKVKIENLPPPSEDTDGNKADCD
jgi:hypothetical protein